MYCPKCGKAIPPDLPQCPDCNSRKTPSSQSSHIEPMDVISKRKLSLWFISLCLLFLPFPVKHLCQRLCNYYTGALSLFCLNRSSVLFCPFFGVCVVLTATSLFFHKTPKQKNEKHLIISTTYIVLGLFAIGLLFILIYSKKKYPHEEVSPYFQKYVIQYLIGTLLSIFFSFLVLKKSSKFTLFAFLIIKFGLIAAFFGLTYYSTVYFRFDVNYAFWGFFQSISIFFSLFICVLAPEDVLSMRGKNEKSKQDSASNSPNQVTAVQDSSSVFILILSCLLPILGIIFYLVWKPMLPKRAASAGKGVLIGIAIWAVGSLGLLGLKKLIINLIFYSF